MGIFPFQTFCSEFSRLICSSLQDDYEYFLLTCSIFLNERGRDSERNGTSVERFSFRVRFFFEIFATQPLRRCVAAAQTSSSPTMLVLRGQSQADVGHQTRVVRTWKAWTTARNSS